MAGIIGYCANVALMGIRSARTHLARMAKVDEQRFYAHREAQAAYDGTGATFPAYNAAVAKADAEHAAAVAVSKAQHAQEIAELALVGGQFRTEAAAREHLAKFPMLSNIVAVMPLVERSIPDDPANPVHDEILRLRKS